MSLTNPADQSFAVHLESLLGFAQELTTQVHGITKPSGELEGLLNTPVRLGAFNEADSLNATHAASVAEMHLLLADVQEALSFANDVTKTVADGYRKLDTDLAAYLGADGVLNHTDSANTPAASGSSGPAGLGVSTGAGIDAGLGIAAGGVLPTGSDVSAGGVSAGVDAGPVTVAARADGLSGVQLDIDGTTVTAGLDGVHIETGDPSTGATTGISVPLAGTPSAPPVTGV